MNVKKYFSNTISISDYQAKKYHIFFKSTVKKIDFSKFADI